MKPYPVSLAAWAAFALSAVDAFVPPKRVTPRVSLSSEPPSAQPTETGTITGKDGFGAWPIENFGEEGIGATIVYPQVGGSFNKNIALFFDKGNKNFVRWNFAENRFVRQKKVRDLSTRNGFRSKDKPYPFEAIDACLVLPQTQDTSNTNRWPAFFFSGDKVVEWDLTNDDEDEKDGGGIVGEVKPIKEIFPLGAPFDEGIDAVCVLPNGDASDPTEASAVFFRKEQFVVWDLNEARKTETGTIKGTQGCPFETIDAALVLPSDSVYLFSGKKYAEWKTPFVFSPQVTNSAVQPNSFAYPNNLKRIRFNKCPPVQNSDKHNADSIKDFYDADSIKTFYKGHVHKSVFPLIDKEYPLTGNKLMFLKKETNADSVVVDDDVQFKNENFTGYFDEKGEFINDPVTKAVIKPFYPSDGLEFWKEMDAALQAQILRETNSTISIDGTDASSNYIRWPSLWYNRTQSMLNTWPFSTPSNSETLTLDFVAQSVRGEFSNYHQQRLLVHLSKNVSLATDIGLHEVGSGFRSVRDFIGLQLRMAKLNAWSLEAVAPINFYLKWHFGVPRPEEVAYLIKDGKIKEDGLDNESKKVIQNIKDFMDDKEYATDFTAYPDGSPTHPSFPAMHSAGSTCSIWIPTLYKLTVEQFREALRTDYGVAFARTAAGVHYPQDNLAGLNLGQRIVREKLPEYLEENFGYDSTLVEEKLKKLSFDWREFDINDDTIEKVHFAKFFKDRLGEDFFAE